MKRTKTYQKEAYLASTYFSPVGLAKLQGFRPEQSEEIPMPSTGVFGFVSAIWLWLRLWFVGQAERGVEPVCDFELIEGSPRPNRARRHQNRHIARRSKAKPARNLAPFYVFGPRVSPTQLLERRCRLSCWGRIQVYRIVYYAHRLARYALLARFARGGNRMPCGLCRAHLWPT